MGKIKIILIPLLIFIVSIIVLQKLIPEYHPFGGVRITKNENSIIDEAKNYFQIVNHKIDYRNLNVEYSNNENFVNWIESKYPLNEANEILKNSDLAYYWEVKQSGDKDSTLVIRANSDETKIKRNELISFKISDDGKIISFTQNISDTLISTHLTSQTAKELAINFIRLFRDDIVFVDDSTNLSKQDSSSKYFYKDTETTQKSNNTSYKITWQKKSKYGYVITLNTEVIGDQVEGFSIQPEIPQELLNKSFDVFKVIQEVIYLLLIIISVMIFGFKKFRAFEIGFKQAIIFGILILFSFVIKQILERSNSIDGSLILGLILGGIFISGAAVILWSVSETMFREVWNDKFLSLDLIFHGKFSHSLIGKSLVNGISFSLGLTALFFILLRVLSEAANMTFSGNTFLSQSFVTAYLPPLNILFGVINAYAILAVSFFMFLTAATKRYINNDSVFILVSGLIWALLVESGVNPLTTSIPINLVIGLILSFVLIKYDLLTTLISYLLFQFFIKASELSFIEQTELHDQWFVILGLASIFIIFGIIIIFKKDKFTDYESITPKFVENVTERQRLKRELEVARHVQMSFLPKDNPQIDGLDIASTCIPALEVGGDYYDFISLGEKKIGIIIGDVSGKGTQAAFYMTLTKGFLKALAKQTDSPSEVLSRMNELFYENVERGRFISMIYAIVDLENRTIKIARAGHNPVILNDLKGKISFISPNGLALGLEKGTLFRKVITEYQENLEPGKNYIFYTDGFTEAVNKKGEEYGLEKLSNIANSLSDKSAENVMNEVMQDVQKFIGKAKQHDDMTIVILKIL
jgi:hypothetical protein